MAYKYFLSKPKTYLDFTFSNLPGLSLECCAVVLWPFKYQLIDTVTLCSLWVNAWTLNIICRCLEKGFFAFFSVQSHPLSNYSNWELPPAFHFPHSIQETPRGSVCRRFQTRCSIQMGRQLNGHSVDLWSLVGYLGTFGAQLFIQQHTKGEEQVFLCFYCCHIQFESQICRCNCKLFWGIKSEKPHNIWQTSSLSARWLHSAQLWV